MLTAGGEGEADLIQQRPQQPKPHAGVHGPAGQGDSSGGEGAVGVAVQGGQGLVHRYRLRRARVLAGGCDDLSTPRTLGPLRDATQGTRGPLERALADGSSEAVFAAAIEELTGPPPTVLIVEDLHWADDATLDVLGYLGRRVNGRPRRCAARCAGKGMAEPSQPCRFFTSPGFTPDKHSRTRTSPAAGSGNGRSPTCNTSTAGPWRSY